MARKGGQDRGLASRTLANGKTIWYARLAVEGLDQKFGPFDTKTQARMFYQQAKTEQQQRRFFPDRYQSRTGLMAGQAIKDYLKTAAHKKSAKDDQRYGEWWMNRLGTIKLTNVTPTLIETARAELEVKGLSKQTVLHYLKFLRHILNRAVRDEHLVKSPFTKLTLPKVTLGSTRILSVEEEKELFKKLGDYADWVRVMLYTGLRREAGFRLKWTDLDLKNLLIQLPAMKGEPAKWIPLNPEAARILKKLPNHSSYVFPGKNPDQSMDPDNFYHRVWTPAVNASGIPWCRIQDLRHTFASRLAMQGHPESAIAILLGHMTTAMARRYTHITSDYLKMAVANVHQFGKKVNRSTGTKPEKSKGGIQDRKHK